MRLDLPAGLFPGCSWLVNDGWANDPAGDEADQCVLLIHTWLG